MQASPPSELRTRATPEGGIACKPPKLNESLRAMLSVTHPGDYIYFLISAFFRLFRVYATTWSEFRISKKLSPFPLLEHSGAAAQIRNFSGDSRYAEEAEFRG